MRLKQLMPDPPKNAGFFRYRVACGWQGKNEVTIFAKTDEAVPAALGLFHPLEKFDRILSKQPY